MPKLLLLANKMIHNESEIETSHGKFLHYYLAAVDSTNSYAMNLLKGAPEKFKGETGFLVTTSEQTSGRGQRGNLWSSSPDLDVAMSWVVLQPPQVGAAVFNMAAALATGKGIRKAIEEVGKVELPSAALAVKWPNDVFLWHNGDYRKVSGILVENQWRGENWTASVVGIGVNAMSRRVSKAYNAVSVSEVVNVDINPSEIEKRILEFLLEYLKMLGQSEGAGGDFSSGAKSIAREFNSELYGRDELREFEVDGKNYLGKLKGVDENGMGEFEWQDDNHPPKKLHSSEVKWIFGLHSL